MKRLIALFFLTCSLAVAGDAGPWAPFPLDATNTIYDKRIVSNLVYAINERCDVVTGVPPIDPTLLTGFVTRAVLKLIDDKIDELVPHFIDRSFTNLVAGEWVYNGWYRKYNAGLDIYNFDLGGGITQGLPRLNLPQAFRQTDIGTNIWPLKNWQDQITNYPPLQLTEDRITTFLDRPEYTLVPDMPIVAVIGEWKYTAIYTSIPDPIPPYTNPPTISTNAFWMDSRLNTIPSNTLNYSNYVGKALPCRPFPYQGRLYDNTKLPYMQWFSTNAMSMGVAGSVRGIAYDDTGDLYRQNILTNDGFTVFEVQWPAQNGGVPVLMTNLFLQLTNSVSAWPNSVIADGLPVAGIGTVPHVGDVIRIWYELDTIETFSGVEPYTDIDRDYANILWKECLNERYQIINAMRWTTPSDSGGEYYWQCPTAYVLECDAPYAADGWPTMPTNFPIQVYVGKPEDCITNPTYAPPDYGAFPGWIERTNPYAINSGCTNLVNTGVDQYPRTIYSAGGTATFQSTYGAYYGFPTNILIQTNDAVDFDIVWYIDSVYNTISDTTSARVDWAISKPIATITNAISNYAWQVDFYLFGSNSILAADTPEWLPMKTQSVSQAAGQYVATGQPVEASVPFVWQLPSFATSSITVGDCPYNVREDWRTNATTTILVRAASYLANTQSVIATNITYNGWQYKSNLINDVLDGGRTNRFETKYYWVLYEPETSWGQSTNAIAYYYYVQPYTWTTEATPCADIESEDDDPAFSAITFDLVTTNDLTPWDDLAAIYGFYPTGTTRIVDGYTNNAGDPQGDWILTLSTYDPLAESFITYSNDEIALYYYQIPVYTQTVMELLVPHKQTNECVYAWGAVYPGSDWAVFDATYDSSIVLSNSVTNAWIMQWQPVIKWDVAGGFDYK